MPDVPETLRHDTAPNALFKNMNMLIRELLHVTAIWVCILSVLMPDETHILFTGITKVTFRCAGLIDDRVVRLPFCPQCILYVNYLHAAAPLTPLLADCSMEARNRLRNNSGLPLTNVTDLAVLDHFFSAVRRNPWQSSRRHFHIGYQRYYQIIYKKKL